MSLLDGNGVRSGKQRIGRVFLLMRLNAFEKTMNQRMMRNVPQKLAQSEKYLNLIWATIALGLAYETFQDIRINSDANLIIWFLLHSTAAVLFFIRHPPLAFSTSPLAYGVALGSVNYYLLYDFTIVSAAPVAVGEILIFSGGVMGLVSTLSLGKCFGILPVYRGIRTKAAYQLIRHPIYASYILLDSGIVIAFPSWDNGLIFCIAIMLFVLRIRYEEEVLEQASEYQAYQKKVKFKLIPLIY